MDNLHLRFNSVLFSFERFIPNKTVKIFSEEEGALAQLGERLLCTQEVSGSIPLGSIVNEDVKIGDLIIEN